ncbi:MAG: hypothetical protein HKN76_19135 [Saprospiraceae bacterium]|nr:hypothetical protein [Saprospiraceae bacterium]
MDADTKLEMVDRYILGQMNQDEIKEFEKLMTGDLEIKSLVEDQRKLIKGMGKYQEKAEFFDMLQEIKKDRPAEKIVSLQQAKESKSGVQDTTSKLRKLRYRLAYAAGIAILVTAILFMLDTRVNTDSLVASNFSFHPDILTAQLEASGATNDVNQELIPLLQRGIQFYNNQEYEQAGNQFQQFAAQSAGRNYLVMLNDFYLAQIALSEDRPEETIALLQPLLLESGLPIESSVKWYLSLAYLKSNDSNAAEKLLGDLRDDSEYGTQSNKILNKLR